MTVATSYFPFDAGAGSAITEAQWQKMARRWLGTGVLDDYLNELAVTADGSAMSVSVNTGGCWIEGFYFESDAAAAQTIEAADATNGRIDYVVVELDRTANTIAFKVVAGTAASSPVAPTLTQTDALWQMPLATVLVDAAVGVIAADKVTDRRTLVKNQTGTLGRWRKAANQAVAHATGTDVSWDTVVREDGITRAVPFTSIPVPAAGWYLVEAGVRWESNATGLRRISLLDDLGAFLGQDEVAPVSGGQTIQNPTFLVYVAAGRSLRINAFQSSTLSLNIEFFQEHSHLAIGRLR